MIMQNYCNLKQQASSKNNLETDNFTPKMRAS
uniref:Uncharacterized protein n=1 Tax=Arundo donax TaxID=35708 RepID=A0A0A9EY99_ARUDO